MNQSSETRRKNTAAREAKRLVSLKMRELVARALMDVLESPTTTPQEKLRAAELWREIDGRT